MARYIDAEHLMQKLSRMIDYCEKNKDKRINPLNTLFQVGDAIMDCPTCDVVPRSEVEHWKEEANHYQNLWCQTYNELAEAKQEVARMVFEELETSLFYKFIYGETHLVIREADYNHYKKKYVGEVTKDA